MSELRADGAAALELVEPRYARGGVDAVPEAEGQFARRRRSHHRPEERHPVDRNDRDADIWASQFEGVTGVGRELGVTRRVIGGIAQLGLQAALLERLGEDRVDVRPPARVPPGFTLWRAKYPSTTSS